MNVYYAIFRKTDDSNDCKFIIKIYRATYAAEAEHNATKDWNKNFPTWEMTFYRISFFDEFNSVKVSEVSK